MKEDKKYFDLKQLAEKIHDNSYYPPYVPNVFYFYNKETANKITEAGMKAIREMNYE